MRAELKEAEMNIYYSRDEATALNHGKVTLNLIMEDEATAREKKKLAIPYDRYWLCKSHNACPECGKQMDSVRDKCCLICLECYQDGEWDEIEVLK